MLRKVRVGNIYRFNPVGLDIFDPRTQENVKPGDLVQVVNLPGCPRANVMGHCHIRTFPGKRFAGLVLTNSLQRVNWRKP